MISRQSTIDLQKYENVSKRFLYKENEVSQS